MDRAVATANLEALHPMCETLLLTLLSLYEQWHGDYSAEVPRFSGIGAGGTTQVSRWFAAPLRRCFRWRREIW